MTTSRFFYEGGTLDATAPSYIKRSADNELTNLLMQNEICYILTPRQTGKSSLMVRAKKILESSGFLTAVVDFSILDKENKSVKNQSAQSWYLGVSSHILSGLEIDIDLKKWWQEKGEISPSLKFFEFLKEIVLAKTKPPQPIVLFFDEIDFIRGMDFTDGFFAIIRACHNSRATNSDFKRLTFGLFGVASPSDLISDKRRTPFNIGTRVQLADFSFQECKHFLKGLPFSNNEQILKHVYHWTNGHPFFTQRICAAISRQKEKNWNDLEIDRLVISLFFGANAWKDKNLPRTRDELVSGHLVKTYKKVLKKKTRYDENNISHPRLQLTGIISNQDGFIEIRNRIYKSIFNEKWIKENIEVNWAKRIAYALTIAIAIVTIALGSYSIINKINADKARAQIEIAKTKASLDSLNNIRLREKARADSNYIIILQQRTYADSINTIRLQEKARNYKNEAELAKLREELSQKSRTVAEGFKQSEDISKSYTNDNMNFTREFIAGDIKFKIFPDTKYKTISTIFIPYYDEYFRPNMVITRDILPSEVSLEEFTERQKKLLLETPGFSITKIHYDSTFVLGTVKGHKLIYSLIPASGSENQSIKMKPVTQLQIIFINKNIAYSITASTSAQTWNQLEPDIMDIVYSLNIEGFIRNNN